MLQRTWLLALALSVLTFAGGTAADENLSIADAEAAGFVKEAQQIYQMVGAKDGWAGIWAGDVVELFEYADAYSAKERAKEFNAAVQSDNISGWVEICVVRNLVMLSKGNRACRQLEALA